MRNFPIYIHLYVNEDLLQGFINGRIDNLYGYTKEVKGSQDIVHLSIPLGKVSNKGYGVYKLNRTNFEGEF